MAVELEETRHKVRDDQERHARQPLARRQVEAEQAAVPERLEGRGQGRLGRVRAQRDGREW